MRERFFFGIKESQGSDLVARALTSAGLSDGSGIVLFGGIDTPLSYSNRQSFTPYIQRMPLSRMVLGPTGHLVPVTMLSSTVAARSMDIRVMLHECVTEFSCALSSPNRTIQTFLLKESKVSQRHLAIWGMVRVAQTRALEAARAGVLAKDVDTAARNSLGEEGFGSYFTHRLGHGKQIHLRMLVLLRMIYQHLSVANKHAGIGLEGHESPYLNGASTDVLMSGHSFSDEPGVYIEGEV